MMILKGIYDSMNKRLMIDFSCSLLREHYDVLDTIIKKHKKAGYISKSVELQKLEDSRCIIIIPMEIPGSEKFADGERMTGIPKDLLNNITFVIEDFKNSALEKELKTTEFIPLTGYPVEKLKADIMEAIKNKRNFCLIEKYSDYKKFFNHEVTKLRQYKVLYPSNDYSEVALSIYEGDLKSLREQYIPKLEEVDWE